jgi:tetratricopeptide (TPR) repeat protein
MLLFNYHPKREQYVILGFLFICALMPFLFTASPVLLAPQSQIVKTLWQANFGYWGQKEIDQLQNHSITYPKDGDILFTLGLVHKKERNFKTAQIYYQKTLDLNPDHYKAHLNLGNVYFATKNWEKAIEQYKKVISLAPPPSALAHYNLSRTYLQKYMFEESEKELLQAKKIDSAKIDYYLNTSSENYNRIVIDEKLSKSELLKKALQYSPLGPTLTQQLWSLFFRGIPLSYCLGVILMCIFLALVSTRDKTYRIAVRCKCCGRAFCKRCQRLTIKNIICKQCSKVLRQQKGIDSSIRKDKIIIIERYLNRYKKVSALLSIVLPGAGLIWRGYPIKGTAYLFLFFFLLLNVLFKLWFVETPWDFSQSHSYINMIPSLALLVTLWMLLLKFSFGIKDETVELSSLMRTIKK